MIDYKQLTFICIWNPKLNVGIFKRRNDAVAFQPTLQIGIEHNTQGCPVLTREGTWGGLL